MIGKIADAKTGAPLHGVSVKIKSVKGGGTFTSKEWAFTIEAATKDGLEVSSVGFNTELIVYKKAAKIFAAF